MMNDASDPWAPLPLHNQIGVWRRGSPGDSLRLAFGDSLRNSLLVSIGNSRNLSLGDLLRVALWRSIHAE